MKTTECKLAESPKDNYQIVSNVIADKIGWMGAILLSILVSVNEQRKSATFFLSTSELEKLTGWSAKTIREWVKVLKDNGLLTTKEVTGCKQRYTLYINNIEAAYGEEGQKEVTDCKQVFQDSFNGRVNVERIKYEGEEVKIIVDYSDNAEPPTKKQLSFLRKNCDIFLDNGALLTKQICWCLINAFCKVKGKVKKITIVPSDGIGMLCSVGTDKRMYNVCNIDYNYD